MEVQIDIMIIFPKAKTYISHPNLIGENDIDEWMMKNAGEHRITVMRFFIFSHFFLYYHTFLFLNPKH